MQEEETAWAAGTDKNRRAAAAPSERAEAGEKVHGASRIAPSRPLSAVACVSSCRHPCRLPQAPLASLSPPPRLNPIPSFVARN